MSALQLDKVRFSRSSGFTLACDVAIAAGERVALMGASGSGKTTVLDLIAGFSAPASGRILFEGRDMTAEPPAARPVSMLFQSDNLFGHLDAFANVGLGISPALRLTSDDRRAVETALGEVGLAGKAARRPGELSGGERQRVAIARLLVRRKPLLLLDEPFASLGPALAADMLDLVSDVASRTGAAVLLVTHDPREALRFATRTIFLDAGGVVYDGPSAELEARGGEAARRYLGG